MSKRAAKTSGTPDGRLVSLYRKQLEIRLQEIDEVRRIASVEGAARPAKARLTRMTNEIEKLETKIQALKPTN